MTRKGALRRIVSDIKEGVIFGFGLVGSLTIYLLICILRDGEKGPTILSLTGADFADDILFLLIPPVFLVLLGAAIFLTTRVERWHSVGTTESGEDQIETLPKKSNPSRWRIVISDVTYGAVLGFAGVGALTTICLLNIYFDGAEGITCLLAAIGSAGVVRALLTTSLLAVVGFTLLCPTLRELARWLNSKTTRPNDAAGS